MLKVALTGGIGSGKTVVSKVFEVLGIPVFNADESAKRILQQNEEIKKKVQVIFGSEAYIQGIYNRKYIAEAVFKNKELLSKLNEIVHPAVHEDFLSWASVQSAPYCIREAALIKKSPLNDKILYVYAPENVRIKRVLDRDKNRSEALVRQIIDNQKTEEEFRSLADYVINNDENSQLIPQILKMHRELIA